MLLIAAAAALMAATGVITMAVAFAIYAAFEPLIGRAFAAAATAGVFAVAIALTALVLGLMAEGRRRSRATRKPDAGLTGMILDLVRDKPFAAAGIAAALGLVAVRNPRTIAAVLSAFIEGWRGGSAMRKKS